MKKRKFFQLEIGWQNYRIPFWFFLVSLLFIFLILSGIVISTIFNSTETDSRDKLVTIYDQGQERTIKTQAKTVSDALDQAEIEVDKSDKIEPSLSTFIVSNSFSVNIYRAQPIVVIDGEHETRVVTSAQTGKTIAKEAKVKLRNEDIVKIDRNNDILNGDGAVAVATVKRAIPVNLILYGQSMTVYTQAQDVSEFLQEKNINIDSDVFIFPSKNTKIKANLEIRVWREGINTVTIDEEVPFGKREVQSNDLLVGYSKVETPGKNGRRSVTYELLMKDGKEVSRKEIQSVTIVEPVEQVELIGIKVPYGGSHEDWLRAAGIASSEWSYVDFIIGRESGWRPEAMNASSGATGLCQALPGSKMASAGSDWATNPITQLRWCDGYASGRYGSWASAYNFWINNHWW